MDPSSPPTQTKELCTLSPTIISPTRISQWVEDISKFLDQSTDHITSSNNLPDGSLSEDQHVMDGTVDPSSFSINSRQPALNGGMYAAGFNQEGAQAEAGFIGINQQPNQAPLIALPVQQQAIDYNLLNHNQQQYDPNILSNNLFDYLPTTHLRDNLYQGIDDGNNRIEYPSNSVALQNGNGYASNMMPMNNHSFESRYNETQNYGQGARQMDMNIDMMNTMNNYQTGIRNGQVMANNHFNNPVHSVNDSNQYERSGQQNYASYNNNGFAWEGLQRQAVQNYGDNMPVNFHPNAFFQQISNVNQAHNSFNTPFAMASNQYNVRDNQSHIHATSPGYNSDQRAPGPVFTGLDVPNVPYNLPSNQHTIRNDQGYMPTSRGDQMDTPHGQIPFNAAHPSNASPSNPIFPQRATLRSPFQFNSNWRSTSRVQKPAAASVFGAVDTRPVRSFAPNIPNTLEFDARQRQMEITHVLNPHIRARNQTSDTRRDSSRSSNRVNKSTSSRNPLQAQRLQTQMTNRASYLSREWLSHTSEAHNDSETNVEKEQ